MPKSNWDDPLPPPPWEEFMKESPEEYWKRQGKIAQLKTPDSLSVGKSLATQLPVCITPERLFTHLQIVGGTGTGKTFFMEGLIKQLILSGYGVTVIDPHGDLCRRLLDFCAYNNQQQPELQLDRRVIPFSLVAGKKVVGFNPIARSARTLTYQVVALMEAIRKCWGQDNFHRTPRMARWLFNTNYALIEGQATFMQAYHMIKPEPNAYRTAIVRRLNNPRIKDEWEFFNRLRPKEQEERTESSFSRLKPFTEDPIRPIMGRSKRTLSFPSVLNARKILLCDLSRAAAVGDDERHLLGTFLVNELLTAAFARAENQRVPHFLFVDEFQNFVTKDMCEILDGGRKFGLHLCLANQHLHQLKLKDPEVYYSVLTNARTKAVFAGLIDEDLDVMGKELYTGEFNPNEVKDEIWHDVFEPVESTRLIYSHSTSEGGSESSGESSGEVDHRSLANGEVYIPNSYPWSPSSMTTTSTSGSSSSRGRQSSVGSNWAKSESWTKVPFYEFHKKKQLASRTFRSLEEQLYIKKSQLKRQPQQHLAWLIPGQPVQLLKGGTLAELPKEFTDRHREEFTEAAMEYAGCFEDPGLAETEIAAMEQQLLLEAKPVIEVQSEEEPPAKRKRTPKQKSSSAEPDVFDEIKESLGGSE